MFGFTFATPSFAATIHPDVLTIESNNNRGDGTALGDVAGSENLGDLTGMTAGIAGRIVDSVDQFTFSTGTRFNIDFVNLLNLDGTDIDGCEGFDGSDCSEGSANNENGLIAMFTLDEANGLSLSASFTSTVAAGTPIFSNVAGGAYTFTIDGISGEAGSAYDIAISAVPVPASGLLFIAGLCSLAVVRRAVAKK